MYSRLICVTYVLNIIFQAFFTLLTPVFICFGIGWIFVTYVSAPAWIYAPLILFGVLVGFYSMVKFVLSAMAGYERLEKEQNERRAERAEHTRKSYGILANSEATPDIEPKVKSSKAENMQDGNADAAGDDALAEYNGSSSNEI